MIIMAIVQVAAFILLLLTLVMLCFVLCLILRRLRLDANIWLTFVLTRTLDVMSFIRNILSAGKLKICSAL